MDNAIRIDELQKLANAAEPYAEALKQITEQSSSGLMQLQKMIQASPPYLTEMARIADSAASQIRWLHQAAAQASQQVAYLQRAAESAGLQVAEMARWADLVASRFKEMEEAASPAFAQMRQMAQLIGPQIVELSKARDLFRESQLHETVSSLLRAVPTAGTSPQATSLTIGIAGTALGLRSHEMLGAVIAEARARAANDETINEGQSLATDVFAAWQEADASDEQHAAVLKFLDDFISKIGAYLAKVDSLPGLAGVLPLVMLIVAIISLKYQSESITTEDMEKLVASQQTHSIQANKILLEKIDELIETTRNLAASRIASMAPEIIYKTERSIPVHSDSRMISPPVGALHVGDLVSVKTFAKKWIEIEYFDQLLGRNVRGWVVKKYLKKV